MGRAILRCGVGLAAALLAANPVTARVSITDWSAARTPDPAAARERASLTAELRLRPQDAQAHLQYGRLLVRQYRERRTADWRPAAAAFEFALQLDPTLSAARLELGELYALAGRPALAEQLLAESVAVDGPAAPTLTALSIQALRAGDLSVALWAGRKAAALAPDARALAAAAAAAGVAGTADAADLLTRLRAADARRAEAVARDVASWRRAAEIVAASPDAAPQPSPIAPPSPAAPSATGPTVAPDWRSCDPASTAQPQAQASFAWTGSGSSAGTAPIGPQPMTPLVAPCAAGKPPRMAVVEAVIVRQRDQLQDLRGVNLLNGLQLVAKGSVRAVEHVPSGAEPANPTFLTISLPDSGITYLMDILDDQSARTEVLAKPSLIALDRTPSVFFSGATITVPVTGQYSGSLEEKAIGVSLSVTPTFLSDDEMLLAVTAGRSFLEEGLDAQIDQGIQTTTNQVTANVRLRFDETLVLSGLVEREDTLNSTEVPALGKMPGLGLLFSNRNKQHLRNNVIVLLTPRRPNEAPVRRTADDSLLPVRYDRRLAEAIGALARRETPEAATLDAFARQLAAADLVAKLPLSLAVEP